MQTTVFFFPPTKILITSCISGSLTTPNSIGSRISGILIAMSLAGRTSFDCQLGRGGTATLLLFPLYFALSLTLKPISACFICIRLFKLGKNIKCSPNALFCPIIGDIHSTPIASLEVECVAHLSYFAVNDLLVNSF